MKKYFCVETEEELQFGDVVKVVLFKELEDGKVTVEKEVEFTEDSASWMVDMGFVEEKETDDAERELIHFDSEDSCNVLEDLFEDIEEMEDRIDKLEEKVDKFIDQHKDFVTLMNNMLDAFKEFMLELPEKKNAQPKKK